MANLNDVAREANVSPITVSRVMNGKNSVLPETRDRVLAAAKKLSYQPNLLARGLTIDRTNSIGVLMTRIENPMYSLMISGINGGVSKLEYDILLAGSNDLESSLKSVLTLLQKRVDGLIVLPVEFQSESTGQPGYAWPSETDMKNMGQFTQRFAQMVEAYAAPKFRVVSISSQMKQGVNGRVIESYSGGAKMAVEYLAAHGHQKIGFISHYAKDQGIWGERFQGFLEGMASSGLEVREQSIAYCDENLNSAGEAMRRILEQPEMPTALYCANDTIAVGAMNAAVQAGIRVPEELSFIGHDGSSFGEMVLPPLSTVAIYPIEIGKRAVSLLLDLMDGADDRDIVISPEIIARGSVSTR